MCSYEIETEIFTDFNHKSVSSNHIFQMFIQEQFCDVQLIFNDDRIMVHSVILAGASDYFKMNLSDIENVPKEFTIKNVDSDATRKLIEYCYTGNIELNGANVEKILEVANYFQLLPVVEACTKKLIDALSIKNCLKIWKLAKFQYLTTLEQLVLNTICENFDEVCQLDEFLNLEPGDVIDLLKSNLDVSSELVIFKAVKRWLAHDAANRSTSLYTLFEHIKLPRLPYNVLYEEVKSICATDNRCNTLVLDAIYWKTTGNKRPNLPMYQTEPRIPFNTVVAVGAWNIESFNVVEVYNPVVGSWLRLQDMQCTRQNFSVIYSNLRLILVGGIYAGSATNIVESYTLNTRELRTMPYMQDARVHPAVVIYKDAIYAFGGHGIKSALATVERLQRKTKNWTRITSMPTARAACGVAVVQKEIFIIGGWDVEALANNEAYCVKTGTWRICANMHEKRDALGVAAVNGYIYAVGGRNDKSFFNSSEKYDPQIDKWTVIEPISSVRYSLTAEAYSGRLVVVGGADGVRPLPIVEQYDSDNDRWNVRTSIGVAREIVNVVRVPWNVIESLVSPSSSTCTTCGIPL